MAYRYNREQVTKDVKLYRQRHPEKVLEWSNKWAQANPQRRRAIEHKCKQKLKLEVLSRYSPNGKLGCSWANCAIVDLDMLSIDHINDNGAEHRKELNPSRKRGAPSGVLYRWLKRNGYPEGFQTLCFNHQMKKRFLKQRGE